MGEDLINKETRRTKKDGDYLDNKLLREYGQGSGEKRRYYPAWRGLWGGGEG